MTQPLFTKDELSRIAENAATFEDELAPAAVLAAAPASLRMEEIVRTHEARLRRLRVVLAVATLGLGMGVIGLLLVSSPYLVALLGALVLVAMVDLFAMHRAARTLEERLTEIARPRRVRA